MENASTSRSTVYVIEVCGTDYYDRLEFHSVYADKATAQEYACLLRNKKFDCDEAAEAAVAMDELVYDSVVVSEVTLN